MSSKKKYICPQNECTGCMACINICNHSAIEIIKNEIGFDYPMINEEICINCGLCYKVCPQLINRNLHYPKKCYAAALNNKKELLTCASGGVATALSEYYLNNDGIVVGCSGEDMRNVQHKIVKSTKELNALKGSKYVQSRISSVLFKQVREELKKGTEVLFIGTGCQVAGLQNFLIKKYENLLTIDLVCHGVPSQKMLNDDMDLYSGIIDKTVKFREKMLIKRIPEADDTHVIRYGLSAMQTTRSGKKEKRIWIPWYKDPYLGAFMDCINFRSACYGCLYARPERQSDLTICDYWGLGKDSKLYNESGVSAVLVNSVKGGSLFSKLESILIFEERPIIEAINGNGQLRHPSTLNPKREEYINDYLKRGIRSAYRNSSYSSMRRKYLNTIIRERMPFKSLLSKLYRMIKPYLKRVKLSNV